MDHNNQENRRTARLIRRREVEQRTGLSCATLYRKMARGEFPRPVCIGENARAWVLSEVDDWIAERVLMREGAAS